MLKHWVVVCSIGAIIGLGWSAGIKATKVAKTKSPPVKRTLQKTNPLKIMVKKEIPNNSAHILRTGGPDDYRYGFIDSNEGGWTPPSYYDPPISKSIGTIGDDESKEINLPFSFSFYGNSYSSIYVCSNGFASFGTGYTDYSNGSVPDANTPNNGLYIYWDDLSPQNGGHIDTSTYTVDGKKVFVIEWDSVPHYSSTGAYTFEIQLYEDGDSLAFLYDKVVGWSADYDSAGSATIGIENSDGSTGLLYSYNTKSVGDHDVILFYRVPVQHDISVISLDTIDTEPVVVNDNDNWTVVVKNYGASDETKIDVYMWVSGEGEVDSKSIAELTSGSQTTVTFSWTPTSSGVKEIKFYSTLSNDEIPENDTLFYSATVLGIASQPVSEGFEGSTFPPSGWSIKDEDGDGNTWNQSSYAYEGSYSVRTSVDGSDYYPNNSNDWLYSPLIDLGSYTNAQISYYYFDSLETNYDYVHVYLYSYTGYDDPNPQEIDLTDHTGYTSSWQEFSQIQQNIERYNVVIWQFQSDNSANKRGFYMDNFSFQGVEVHDVAIDSITSPRDTVSKGSSRNATVWVKNYGDQTETFDVIFYIYAGNDTVFANTENVANLAPGNEQQVNFSKTWTVTGENATEYSITAFTTLSQDINTSNDTAESSVTVYAHEGSDNYGWTWSDNATYQWIELFGNQAGANTVDTLALGDEGEKWIHFAHPVIIYGDTFDSVCVGSNGGFDFTNSNITYTNGKLPNSNQGVFFAVFWEDLILSSSKTSGDSLIYVGYFGDTLVVIEWYQVARYYYHEIFTFEALIYTKINVQNYIIYQYKDLSNYSAGNDNATIGIQDTYGSDNYVLYTYDENPYLPNWSEGMGGFAIKFNNPDVTPQEINETTDIIPHKIEFNIASTVLKNSMTVRYGLPKTLPVEITIYDLSGRVIKQLFKGIQEAGYYTYTWDGRNNEGKRVASSIYFVRFKAGNKVMTRKLVVLR